jgi:N-alpha-acetyltransferase 35, NatC auxiliary subunit
VATSTASLVLLENIEVPEFTILLNQALDVVATEKRRTKSPLLDALGTRLEFRKSFLEIVSNTPMSAKERRPELKKCQTLLSQIVSSMDLGKETSSAFSTRIQRRLSISVPPRPMVTIDPKEAAKSMKTILDNLLEFEALYDFKSPHETIVRSNVMSRTNLEFFRLLCG